MTHSSELGARIQEGLAQHLQRERESSGLKGLSRYLLLVVRCSWGALGCLLWFLFLRPDCSKINWDILKILRVHLSKNRFKLGSVPSSREKEARSNCAKRKPFIGRREQEHTSLERQKIAGWLLQSSFPLGDSCGLSGRLSSSCCSGDARGLV